jgi:hypothetical protein
LVDVWLKPCSREQTDIIVKKTTQVTYSFLTKPCDFTHGMLVEYPSMCNDYCCPFDFSTLFKLRLCHFYYYYQSSFSSLCITFWKNSSAQLFSSQIRFESSSICYSDYKLKVLFSVVVSRSINQLMGMMTWSSLST